MNSSRVLSSDAYGSSMSPYSVVMHMILSTTTVVGNSSRVLSSRVLITTEYYTTTVEKGTVRLSK